MTLLSEASFLVTPNGYKEDKLYAAIPTNGNGDMTFTRATTATRVNEAGLVELVPYNLLLSSEEFNTTWTLDGTGVGQSITPNYATAPDGTNTAYRLQLNRTGGTYSRIIQSVTGLTTSYSFSVYMKSNTGFSQNVGLRIKSIGANNVVTTFWQRFTFTGTTNDPSAQIILYNLIAGTGVTADILIWGAQLVEGSSALTYQKTVDRLDIPRIDYTGGGCPSILLEPQRTNILEYSEDFSQWIIQDSATVSSSTFVSPSGENNASLIDLSANTDARVVENFGNSSTQYTLSFYLKKHELDADGTFPLAYYDGSNYIKTYVNLTDVWQRFDLTFTNPSGSTFGYGLSRKGTTSDETLTRCYVWGSTVRSRCFPYFIHSNNYWNCYKGC
jgi:hypothetical protein